MENLTQHAVTRMQQRGIKRNTVELLFHCGAEEYDHRGGTILYFDKQARQRLYRQYGAKQIKTIEGQLDTYAVIAKDGSIMTVGHRTRRINRN